MYLNRTFAVLVCALASMACATQGIAADAWRVVQTVGTVKVGGEGLTPVALTSDRTLPGGAWLETASNARAILVRGSETIAVAPNSRVQLPAEKVNGNTQVLQSLGSVLYQIGKEQEPHFQVETPYLAAVVKGTTFTVTVSEGAASVEVTEGLVEVATLDLTATEHVGAGFRATVGEKQNNIAIERTAAGLAPAKQDEAKAAAPTVVIIPHAIGDVAIDVKDVSGGLVDGPTERLKNVGASTAALMGNGLGGGNGNGLGGGNGNGLGGGNGNGLGGGNGNGLGGGNGNGLGGGNGNGTGNGNGLGRGKGRGS